MRTLRSLVRVRPRAWRSSRRRGRSLLVAAASLAALLALLLVLRSRLAPDELALRRSPVPPGLIPVRGGPTRIGTTVETVEEMVKQNGVSITNLAAETPQHEVEVADFFLMATEVTCEQYAAFVRAAGHRPPQDWAAAAIDDASREHAERVAAALAKAKAEGRPAPEFDKFVRSRWWSENWRGKPWRVPRGAATRPVVYVDFEDVRAYASWAGLRLPTEFEFQRAGRGDTGNVFPWGDEFDVTRAATQELRINGKEVRPSAPLPVASLAQGAVAGLYDLSGNVWEWTSSPFHAYPGHAPLEVEVLEGSRRKKLEGRVDWRSDLRVVVSGSFENNSVAARLTARRPTDPKQATGGMGFRCAWSRDTALDGLLAWARETFPEGSGATLDSPNAVVLESWTWSPGTATTAVGGAAVPVPGYAVIEGHERIAFVPVAGLSSETVERLVGGQGSAVLGALATTVPLARPPLEPGAYFVAFRGAGELDPAAQLVFTDPGGAIRGRIPAPALARVETVAPRATFAEDRREGAASVTLETASTSRDSGEAVAYAIELRFERGSIDSSWLRP